MDSFGIKKRLDVLKYVHTRFLLILKSLVIRPLVLQRPEESLHHGIVVTASRTAHRALDLQRPQRLLKRLTRVLTTSVAVM